MFRQHGCAAKTCDTRTYTMSYQVRHERYEVVVCDICDEYSYIGDRNWREMPQHRAEEPLHLCRKCKPNAVWCSGHQQYHRPDVLHRQPCVDCGGLFTSVARNSLTRCPSCQRSASNTVNTDTSTVERSRSLGQKLFSPLMRYLH
jgi:hypothetical protein